MAVSNDGLFLPMIIYCENEFAKRTGFEGIIREIKELLS